MKTLSTLGLALLLTVSTTSLANTPVNEKLRNNLEIMRDILQKSLDQQEHTANLGRVELSYLAGQGVLFRTQSGGGYSFVFDMDNGNLPLPPLPPMPELGSLQNVAKAAGAAAKAGIATQVLDETEIEEIQQQAEQAVELLHEQQETLREQNRELRDQSRDLARELRDVQREKRDVEFSQKVGSKDADLQKRLSELTAKEQQLQQKVSALQQQYAQAEQALQQKRQEQQKLAQQKQNELIARIGYSFATTLCDYGASLRELKEQEFVGLQLEMPGSRKQGDIYWLLSKAEVNQCISGKINAEALLKKARYYRS